VLEAARGDSAAQTRTLARAALRAIDGEPIAPSIPAVAGFETALLDAATLAKAKLDAGALIPFLQDGRAVVRANTATALGTLGPAIASAAITIGALLRDDDSRVRIAAASALDKLGDAAVVTAAAYLVDGLRGEAAVAAACHAVLAARKDKVEDALLAGLETADEAHGMRVAQLICALPNARELLFIAFDGPAQNVQINAALGIGMLGARGGAAGRQRLVNGLAGPFTRRRAAMVRALSLLGAA
jgi:HEAT repeat protein